MNRRPNKVTNMFSFVSTYGTEVTVCCLFQMVPGSNPFEHFLRLDQVLKADDTSFQLVMRVAHNIYFLKEYLSGL